MNIEKMREEFEAWFEANKHFMLGTRKVSKGDCLFIWQASRSALVIELPNCVGYEHRYDEIEMSSLEPGQDEHADETFALVRSIEVIEAIEAAGVGVAR